MSRVCVFCGSKTGRRPLYSEVAARLGRRLAGRGHDLVYGGGATGLMGVVADSVLEAGGQVIGVIPRSMATREVAHPGLTRMHVVGTMHERKALMAELSDAFIALPGGFGTFEELLEMITWAQLGIHRKPVGLLNADRYFDPLVGMFDRAVQEGFVRPKYRSLCRVGADVDGLLAELESQWGETCRAE